MDDLPAFAPDPIRDFQGAVQPRQRIFFVHGKMAHRHFVMELAFHLSARREHHDLMPAARLLVCQVDDVTFHAAELKFGKNVNDFHASHRDTIQRAALTASLNSAGREGEC